MRIPRLITNKTRRINRDTITFSGLNRNALISDNELSACKNISMTEHNPLISCRPPREVLYTLDNPKSLFSIDDKIVLVDGTNFKYNDVVKGTVASGVKSMVDFNGRIIIMPDKKYYDYVGDAFNDIGTAEYPAAGSCPDMDYICVHMNRVFGVKGCNIYACKQGDVTNWTYFDTVSTASWAADVESEGGDFTGIVSYQNHVVLFKADFMYELYNNKPPYTIQRVNKVGCISNMAIVEVDSALYFVGRKGVYAYTGGTPRLISEKLNENYSDAVLGTDGRLLYLSLYNGTEWNLYAYDTQTGIWIREDNLQAIQFTRIGEHAHALAPDGKLYKFNSGEEKGIEWEIETKNFTEEIFNKKGNGVVKIRIDLEPFSSVNIYTQVDNRGYSLQKSFSTQGQRTYYANIKVQMADCFKVKLQGKGGFKLYAFGREVVVGEGY